MKYINSPAVLATALLSISGVDAAQYIVGVGNLSNGDSDQVVADNTGALSSGSAIAAIGYFDSITDPSLSTTPELIADFQIIYLNDFDVTGGAQTTYGLYDIGNTFDPAEDESIVTNGNGKSLYLFFGNNTTLDLSSSVGLVDVGQTVPDVTQGNPTYTTTVNYSGGDFANGGSIILGSLSSDSYEWGNGTSSGSFKLVLVPEPSSFAFLGLGGLAVLLRRRR